jgi:hypothetical protein
MKMIFGLFLNDHGIIVGILEWMAGMSWIFLG